MMGSVPISVRNGADRPIASDMLFSSCGGPPSARNARNIGEQEAAETRHRRRQPRTDLDQQQVLGNAASLNGGVHVRRELRVLGGARRLVERLRVDLHHHHHCARHSHHPHDWERSLRP